MEKYFYGSDSGYYDSSFVISILEKKLGKSFSEIKDDVNKAQIVVTRDEIVEFLEKTFQEEEPELKERMENSKPTCQKPLGEWTRQDIEDSGSRFVDEISALRYRFEPYTLEYFHRYTTIVKSKALQLLNIIGQIGTRQFAAIQELLTELDIQLDENGNITGEDITRLITPTIQNISELSEKVSKANDLSTYLTFKMSKNSLYRDDWSEGEVYPTEFIFVKDLHSGYRYGNVPISRKHKQELYEKFRKSSKICAKMLIK